MVDALRGERVQLQEQQHFLARVLRGSPGGIVVLDFDGRVSLANPAAERLLQTPGEVLTGAALATLDRALARDLVALAARRTARAGGVGRTARARGARHVPRSRFPPQLLSARRAHRRTAPLREGGVREADPDAVARGQQHGRRLQLTAELLPHLRRAAASARPRGLRTRPRRGHRAHRTTQRVHGAASPTSCVCRPRSWRRSIRPRWWMACWR